MIKDAMIGEGMMIGTRVEIGIEDVVDTEVVHGQVLVRVLDPGLDLSQHRDHLVPDLYRVLALDQDLAQDPGLTLDPDPLLHRGSRERNHLDKTHNLQIVGVVVQAKVTVITDHNSNRSGRTRKPTTGHAIRIKTTRTSATKRMNNVMRNSNDSV